MSDVAHNPIQARGRLLPADAPQGFRALALRHTYNTAHHNLARDFFIPLLSHAIAYDRGVGYFSSGWLKVNAQGLAELAHRGGRARWVTRPLLSRQDLAAFTRIARLEEHKPCLDRLYQTVDELRTALETDTRNTMAWMVADGRLEFRLAIPVGELVGDFHDKFGVFGDPHGHRVSFLGSYNDTPHGLANYESIRLFFSWHADTAEAVADDEQRFARIWLGREPNLRIFALPEAVRARILALRTEERPYPLQGAPSRQQPAIRLPGIFPRAYQKEALAAWIENDRRGILDMATGTGKTIVALEALTHCDDVGFIVVAAPTTALVAQWLGELEKLEGLRAPVEVSNQNPRWPEQVWPRLRLGAARRDRRRPFIVVGTYHSLSSERFLSILNRVQPASGTGLLVADEVHHTGAPTRQRLLCPHFSYRLGLTATLEDAYDRERTQAIEDYFGGVVYRLSIDQAVGSILCRYRYDVHFVELTEDEFAEYQKLTQRIWSLTHRSTRDPDELADSPELLNILLNRRARIVKLAAAKLAFLSALVSQITINKCLIYCADLEQLRAVQAILSARGIDASRLDGRYLVNDLID